jgi:hypothetical protein
LERRDETQKVEEENKEKGKMRERRERRWTGIWMCDYTTTRAQGTTVFPYPIL